MSHEENSEDLDDPIRLFDCSNLLDAGIIETVSSERAVQRNLKYKLSLKSCYMLPVSFFDIPRNIALLNECHPIRVTIVDYYKHPWYFKNKMRLSSETNTTDSAIHSASDDDDGDIICLDLIRGTDKIPSKLLDTTNYTDVIDLTSRDRSIKKRRAKFLDKRRKTLHGKLDLELRKALSQKQSTNIDIKRNKGLVGIKITRRITVDDVAQDANDVESSNDLKNEERNKNNTKVKDTETYVNAFDKLLERVGTVITPVLEENDVYVTSTVNYNHLEDNPPPDNNNKLKIKCQLTNIPPKILENVLKLKEAKLAKEDNEKISFSKSINNLKDNEDKSMTLFNKVIMGSKTNNDQKTSETSSSLSQNKYEKKFSQDEIKFSSSHNIERSKYRPMPRCKKLLENLRNKSSEVKENSIERRDDKTSKKKDTEISGIISPILQCTSTTSKRKTMFKPISKPQIIEPKKNNVSRSVFDIHNCNDCGDKKLLNHHNNTKIKTPQKNIKTLPSSGGNEKDIDKEKTALKLINNERNYIANKEEALRKECSMIAQKLINSIVNHEISTPLQRKDTSVRKQNIQKVTRKIDSNKQIKCSQNARELQSNSKVKPITHNDLKSESTQSISKDGQSKVNIVSVENVRDSNEFNNLGNNVKSVTAQQNMQSDNNLGVQIPDSSVLHRPIRAKTPHQHNIVSENISNFNMNPGNKTPNNNIPVINNQASTIILRPQSKHFHNFNTNGQPIQSHMTCRSQYPKVIKYPTLDKLLSKNNYKEVQIKYDMQPNRYLLSPNQNAYQHHNFVRHPPPHYGVNLVPVRPVYSANFSAPNPNPYWRYGCSSVIPPPPPPPPPLRENYNPNILTDIQPNDNSSIIGRNVNGLVKKINIVTTPTPPLQPEHDTKEGIVKLEPTSPRCGLDMTSNISGGVPKTLSNTIEKPASTKSEMLEELERSMLEKSPTRTDLKRPHFENIVASADPRLPTVPEIGPLSKKMKPDQTTLSTKQTVTVPTKGYSPPILPIPTYQNFLSQVNSTVQNYNIQKPKDILRNPVTPIRHASPMNVNQNNRKAIKRLNYDRGPSVPKPAKKISIADYKKRSSPDTNKVHRVNNILKSVLRGQSAHSKNYNSYNFNTQG